MNLLTLAEWTGARVHIAHHSAADSLYLLREAKRRGVDVTAETCPQYLLLNTEHMLKLGGIMRVNPPIREARHNQPLWDALMDGTIDMIATDHAPHAPEEKMRESIWNCDCGFPGVETQIPPDSKVTVLNPTTNAAVMQQLMSFLRADEQIGGIPEVAFAAEPANLQSGFAVSQVLSQVMDKIYDKKTASVIV